MDKTQNNSKDNSSLDLLHIIKMLWKRAWVICIAVLLVGILGFSLAAFVIPESYSSSVMLYVNNGDFSLGVLNISSSQIAGARSLVETYIVMLQNRASWIQILDEANNTKYTPEQLRDMITAESVNGTEVMRVTVTTGDPREAAELANAIAVVLPRRIGEIVEGSSMAVVDSAAINEKKVAPSITGFTIVGMFVGAVVSILALIIIDMSDGTVRDEEYILRNYEYPILAKIPDLETSDSKSYGYYYQSGSRSKRTEK